MGLFDIFKGKNRTSSFDVPSAPPSINTFSDIPAALPEFPEVKRTKPSISKFEKRAISVEEKELGEREHLKLQEPIYVDLDLFKAMLDETTMSKKHLKTMEDGLARIDDFRSDKQKEFEKWRKSLEDIQRKLIFADKTLFGRS